MLANRCGDFKSYIRVFLLCFFNNAGDIFIDMLAGVKKIKKDDNLRCPFVYTLSDPIRDIGSFNFQKSVFEYADFAFYL